jgi:hypothetical protein
MRNDAVDRAAISELAKAKAAYVKELVTVDKSSVMRFIAKKVEEKFGKTLAPEKLRAAFIEAGGVIQPPGRTRATKDAPAAKSKDTAPTAKTERRKPGRRKADKAAAKAVTALSNLGQHIVVIHNGDTPEVQEFSTPEKARAFLSETLSTGTPASAVGYYTRQTIEITVGI